MSKKELPPVSDETRELAMTIGAALIADAGPDSEAFGLAELMALLEPYVRKAAALDWLELQARTDMPNDIHIYCCFPLPRQNRPEIFVVNAYSAEQGDGPTLLEAVEEARE